MGDEVEPEHPREQDRDVGRKLRAVRERDEDVAADRHRDDEQAERELGAAPAAGEAGDRHHGSLRLWWSGVVTRFFVVGVVDRFFVVGVVRLGFVVVVVVVVLVAANLRRST